MKKLTLLLTLLPALALAQFGAFGGSAPPASSSSRATDAFAQRALFGGWLSGASGLTIATLGFNPIGNLQVVSAAGSNLESNGSWSYNFTGADTIGAEVGWRTINTNYFYPSLLPVLQTYVKNNFGSVTNLRMCVGFIGGATGTCPSDNFTTPSAWFRYSTAVPDSAWMACTRDASTTSCTSTGVAAPAFNVYQRFKVDFRNYPTDVKFYIDDVLVVTKTTNLPASGQGLAVVVMSWPLTAANKSIMSPYVLIERNM